MTLKNSEAKESFKRYFKKRLYCLVLELVGMVELLPRDRTCDVMGRQLLRSSTSIIANYIEGQAATSRRDLKNYLSYSLKSANESKLWIILLRDTCKIHRERSNKLLAELQEISNILAACIIRLKGKKFKI